MRNQPEDNKAHVSVVRTVEYSNSDNEWFASPEEDISGNEVIFPKETRYAMNYLRQTKETLTNKRHLKKGFKYCTNYIVYIFKIDFKFIFRLEKQNL